MKKLCAICLVLLLCASSSAVPIRSNETTKLGSFTGPVGGAAQDDNVKASLDLAHTDLDPMITYDSDVLGLMGIGTGNVFYVDSSASGSTGVDWTNAVATLEAAIQLCTADNGDFIIVAAGHAETATSTIVDVDKAGITIIGLGNGDNRPTYTYDTANDTFTIGATGDQTTLANFRFLATVDSVAVGITVEAACLNWSIIGCDFIAETDGTDEFDDAISVGAASHNGVVKNCLFDAGITTNADTQSGIMLLDCDYAQIIGNRFFGDYAVACIEQKTTASDFIVIDDNFCFNGIIGGDAGLNAVACISLATDTTGFISNNRIACNVANPQLSIVAADCYLFNNIYNETEADSGGQLIGTRAGQTYATVKVATAMDDDLWDVDGGPILITSFVGYITTNIVNATGNLEVKLDADSPATDFDFSTAVDLDNDQVGQRIVFSNANEAVLTPLAGADNGASTLMSSWFCPEGMIEQDNDDEDATGAITWYMTWIPYNDGTTVTVQ